LFGSNVVQHVWQCPGEEYQENCVLPSVEHCDGSIMVWGMDVTSLRPFYSID